ncbi:fused uroporphyrinogen-III synthase HemD/membrane protein HemX [Niveibacterium terrae]|uniref:fused uroporphyrinogen-III synthase HemD/membrane protein HemX n=1 Tax=Niveibacterium terrae TaxID=3373598 RepID=UPI003A8D3778
MRSPVILVTRPAAQAVAFADGLSAAGFTPWVLPLIGIEAIAEPEDLDAILVALDDFCCAVFVSANAVELGLAAIRARCAWPASLALAAPGPGTARVLREAGFSEVLSPEIRFDSEGLLALPEFSAEAIRGRKVLIVGGEGGRELIADELIRRGGAVVHLRAYRRQLLPVPVTELQSAFREGRLAAITLTSSEAARHLGGALEGECGLKALPVFAPHPRIVEAAQMAGFTEVIQTDAADPGLLAGIARYFNDAGDRSGYGYHCGMENDNTTSLPESAPVAPRNRLRTLVANPFVVISLIALILLAWQWLEMRTRLEVLQQQVALRLGESDAATREVRSQSRDAVERIQAQGNRLAVIEAKLSEAQGQQAALEALYQDLSRSRDEAVLAEVEQALNIAQQQLQLAGNVQAALIALQSADARLADLSRPQLLPLRKSIGRDIEKLKALPMADTSTLGLALENLIDRVDALPLAFEHSPPKPSRKQLHAKRAKSVAVAASAAPVEEPGFFSALLADFWNEVKQVIRVERLDRPDPALLSPSQAVFLRENLRLRLLSARLALLQRDGRVFRDDTQQAGVWIERYFDTADRDVAQRLAELKKMQSVRLSLELPNLNESLANLRNARLAGSR